MEDGRVFEDGVKTVLPLWRRCGLGQELRRLAAVIKSQASGQTPAAPFQPHYDARITPVRVNPSGQIDGVLKLFIQT